MIIAAMKEPNGETRVAITPAAVRHYIKLGFDVICEQDAGVLAGFSNDEYKKAGASIAKDKTALLKRANIVVCLNAPSPKTLTGLAKKSLIICPVDVEASAPLIKWCCKSTISLFSMNHIPRISRAQTIDSLSSQANLAGYRAVIEGVSHFNRAIPMMMTAAGMIHPAKVLILGAGVAGLQAIATAKRLGAIVYAFDVRASAKEQVQSLDAEFIEVGETKDSETTGGYAKEMTAEYKQRQANLIDEYASLADIIVCTALIPGKKAPVLLTTKTVSRMKSGSVIVDLATAKGGNCELSVENKIIEHKGITLIGYSNMAGFIPATASELYANNLVNLMPSITTSPLSLHFNKDDEIIKQALLCHEGEELQHG